MDGTLLRLGATGAAVLDSRTGSTAPAVRSAPPAPSTPRPRTRSARSRTRAGSSSTASADPRPGARWSRVASASATACCTCAGRCCAATTSRMLQRRLNALGFDAGREDGILGPETEAALRQFQRDAGIATDGVCGPATIAALGTARLVRRRFGRPRPREGVDAPRPAAARGPQLLPRRRPRPRRARGRSRAPAPGRRRGRRARGLRPGRRHRRDRSERVPRRRLPRAGHGRDARHPLRLLRHRALPLRSRLRHRDRT